MDGLGSADPYRAPPTTRGATIHGGFADVGNLKDIKLCSEPDAWEEVHCGLGYQFYQEDKRADASEEFRSEFIKGDKPPLFPDNEFYELEPTTCRMRLPHSGSAHKIGSDLLHFFKTDVKATIVKSRPLKFWVSAQVFMPEGMCKVKARGYDMREDVYALEFQRKKGDALAFNNLYTQVTVFFRKLEYDLLEEPAAFMWSAPLSIVNFDDAFLEFDDLPLEDFSIDLECDTAAFEVSQQDVVKLLDDMLSEMSQLQTEALILLANLVTASPSVCRPSIDKLTDNIYVLLTGSLPDDPEAEHALGRLLFGLSSDSEASLSWAHSRVLELLTDKVCSDAFALFVKKDMAQAIAKAAENIRNSADNAEEMLKQVGEALPGDLDLLQIDESIRSNLKAVIPTTRHNPVPVTA